MKLSIDLGCWIIPPTRAVWLPAGYLHQTSAITALEMRTLYIDRDACTPSAPMVPQMLRVSPLLRALILRAVELPSEYEDEGQDGRIIATLLGEIDWTPIDPVSLPTLKDRRLQRMEKMLLHKPGDRSTLEVWSDRLAISPRTITRLLSRETALSFQAWRDRVRAFAAIPLLVAGRPLNGDSGLARLRECLELYGDVQESHWQSTRSLFSSRVRTAIDWAMASSFSRTTYPSFTRDRSRSAEIRRCALLNGIGKTLSNSAGCVG